MGVATNPSDLLYALARTIDSQGKVTELQLGCDLISKTQSDLKTEKKSDGYRLQQASFGKNI